MKIDMNWGLSTFHRNEIDLLLTDWPESCYLIMLWFITSNSMFQHRIKISPMFKQTAWLKTDSSSEKKHNIKLQYLYKYPWLNAKSTKHTVCLNVFLLKENALLEMSQWNKLKNRFAVNSWWCHLEHKWGDDMSSTLSFKSLPLLLMSSDSIQLLPLRVRLSLKFDGH